MNDIIEALKRKREFLKKAYNAQLNTARWRINSEDEINSGTFEANMINHLVEMNKLKAQIKGIDEALLYIEQVVK